MAKKNLKDFLEAMNHLTSSNILFLKDPRNSCYCYFPGETYRQELKEIQELINSFDFVKKENNMKIENLE